MTTAAIRIHVRHAGDATDFYAERDRKATERREALEARQAALRESDPELATWVAKKGRR